MGWAEPHGIYVSGTPGISLVRQGTGKSRTLALREHLQGVKPGCWRGRAQVWGWHLLGASADSHPTEGFFSSPCLLSSSQLLWAGCCG